MHYLSLIFIFILSLSIAKADWEADVRLTNTPDTSRVTGYHAWNIGASGDTLHVTFYDNRFGNYEVFYKRSTDGGDTWGEDVRITNDEKQSRTSCLAVSGSDVYLAWGEQYDEDWGVAYTHSTDGGDTWEQPVKMSLDTSSGYQPIIALSGESVYMVWTDIWGDFWNDGDYDYEIVCRKSTDRGKTWSDIIMITEFPDRQYNPAIATDGSIVHVFWNDNNLKELFYKRSDDEGESWGEINQLTDAPGWSQLSCVTVENHIIHLVWADTRKMVNEIYYSQSADSGKTWSQSIRLSYANSESWWPSIAASGQNVYIVWQDERNGLEIYYTKSTDGGKTWTKEMLLSDNSGAKSERPSVCISGTAVHVVWYDTRDHDNADIYYKRDPIGNVTGVSDHIREMKLGVYPNPAGNFVCIKNISADLLPIRVEIFNSVGKLVLQDLEPEYNSNSGVITIPTDRLRAGFYYIQIKSSKYSRTEKFIIID